MDLSAQPFEAVSDPILDAAFAAYQAEQRTLSRRYSAILVLRIAAQSLRAEGLLPEVRQDGERLILSVAVPGLVAGGGPVAAPSAAPSVSPMAAVSLPDLVPVAGRSDEDAPGDRWLDCAALCEGAEQRSEPKSETAAAPDVSTGQAVASVADVCPPVLASDAGGGGGGASAPVAAVAEPADRPGDLVWRGYSAADDDLIVAEIAGAFARGEAKAAGVRAAADRLGRSAKAIDLRANGKLAERIRALKDAAPPVAHKAEASAAAPAPMPAPAPAPEPLVAAPRPTVQARAVPDEKPAPEGKGASVPDLDLRHHLEDLPRKLGKVSWFRADDIALMEAHCARKKLAEVALDLKVDAKVLSDRIDLLTGLHENDRGLKVARWSRTDVLAALKALGG